MQLLDHLSPYLLWTLTVAFVAFPAAFLLWAAVQVERSHRLAGTVRQTVQGTDGRQRRSCTACGRPVR